MLLKRREVIERRKLLIQAPASLWARLDVAQIEAQKQGYEFSIGDAVANFVANFVSRAEAQLATGKPPPAGE